MMKTITKILLLLLVAALLCGCASEVTVSDRVTIVGSQEELEVATEPAEPAATESSEKSYPYDYTKSTIFNVKNCYNYVPWAEIKGVLENNQPVAIKQQDGYVVHQGACTDGTYVYFLLANPNGVINGQTEENCIMFKIDMSTWEVVEVSDPLRVQHGNSITYNPNTGKLVVSHCKPDANQISIVDPETMVVEKTVTLTTNIWGIAYNSARNLYVGRYGDDMFVFDENFKQIDKFVGVNDLLGVQNIACDDNYIYMLNSGVIAMPGTEGIAVYDWNGGFRGVYRVGSLQETESLLIHDGKFYITFYTGNGGTLYELNLDLDMLNY